MTSSYNLSRRKNLYDKTNWGAFQKNIGTCPPDYTTVPIVSSTGAYSDWKFCVPPEEQKQCNKCHCKCMNEEHFHPSRHYVKKHGTMNFYDNPDWEPQSFVNYYPPGTRKAEREYLDKHDYFRLPVKFNATGYEKYYPIDYQNTAVVNTELKQEWDKFRLIQRQDVKNKMYQEFQKL